MLKHPWHFTSCAKWNQSDKHNPHTKLFPKDFTHRNSNINTMKNELGDCTSLLSLCFLFSRSAGGWSKSISFWSTCSQPATNHLLQHNLISNIKITLTTFFKQINFIKTEWKKKIQSSLPVECLTLHKSDLKQNPNNVMNRTRKSTWWSSYSPTEFPLPPSFR